MFRYAWFTILPTFLILSVASYDASAQDHRIGAHLGLNASTTDLFIGGHAEISVPGLLGPHMIAYLNPGIDVHFVSGMTYVQIDANLLLPFALQGAPTFFPFAGAGLAVLHSNFDEIDDLPVADSLTELGFNVFGGARFNVLGALQPFGKLQYTFLSGNYFSLIGGVSLAL